MGCSYRYYSFFNSILFQCGPDEHVAMLEKSVSQIKVAQKHNTTLLRRVAILEAERMKSLGKDERFFFSVACHVIIDCY